MYIFIQLATDMTTTGSERGIAIKMLSIDIPPINRLSYPTDSRSPPAIDRPVSHSSRCRLRYRFRLWKFFFEEIQTS